MSLNGINIPNSIDNLAYTSGINASRPNFTAVPPQKTQKSSIAKKVVLGGVLLGIATVLAITGKKFHDFKKLYGTIWEDVTKGIDKSKFQIEKPKLKLEFFQQNKNKENFGGFVYSNNTIEINLISIFKNKYFCYSTIPHHGVYNTGRRGILSGTSKDIKKFIDGAKKVGFKESDLVIKKLNFKERILNLIFILAHEQRHCLQSHFLLNDSKYGPEYLLKNWMEVAKKENITATDEQLLKTAKKVCPYISKFKPKANTSDLTLLSYISDGKKRVTIKTSALARAQSEYQLKDYNKYVANCLETDANAFATNYLITHPEFKKGCDSKTVEEILRVDNFLTTEDSIKFIKENLKHIETDAQVQKI